MENIINKAGFGIGYTNTTIRFNMYSLSMFCMVFFYRIMYYFCWYEKRFEITLIKFAFFRVKFIESVDRVPFR